MPVIECKAASWATKNLTGHMPHGNDGIPDVQPISLNREIVLCVVRRITAFLGARKVRKNLPQKLKPKYETTVYGLCFKAKIQIFC